MLRDLIVLPLRLGLSAAGVAMRLGRYAVSAALTAPWRLTEAVLAPERDGVAPDDEQAANAVRVDVPIARPSPARAAPSSPASAAPEREPAQEAEAPLMPEFAPAHVSEEPELVESFAEPGAEESVGAAVHVDEPWEGYARMSAKEVIARLTDAGREELAAVTLYESGHRARRTVLAAADRQLRRATAAGGQPT
jgi:hypothetical protein